MSGECVSADDSAKKWHENMALGIEEYAPKDIFN
jgi:hypothetical protein